MPDWDKRKFNRNWSTNYLDKKKILYVSHNNGAHLVVYSDHGLYDFWPGTGLWIHRDTYTKGRGIMNMMKDMDKRKGSEL